MVKPATAAADVVVNMNNNNFLLDYSNLIPKNQLYRMVEGWLEDDMPSHMDVGGFVVGNTQQVAKLYMKSHGVLAGNVFVNAIFDVLSCQIEWHDHIIKEGNATTTMETDSSSSNNRKPKLHIATVTGPIHQILRGERTALNVLSRCSGVATAARRAVELARSLGWKGYVAGTRKTTPGFRLVEKYGLLVGGAATHRLDLSQMVMLKDNHIWSCTNIVQQQQQQKEPRNNHNKSTTAAVSTSEATDEDADSTTSISNAIQQAVQMARQVTGFSQKIEVECQSLDDALQAARAGADIVMLDNMTPIQIKQNARAFKQLFPHVLVEASGGITIDTMAEYLSDHVDIVSQGQLTQGYACLDFSLKIENTTTTTTK